MLLIFDDGSSRSSTLPPLPPAQLTPLPPKPVPQVTLCGFMHNFPVRLRHDANSHDATLEQAVWAAFCTALPFSQASLSIRRRHSDSKLLDWPAVRDVHVGCNPESTRRCPRRSN